MTNRTHSDGFPELFRSSQWAQVQSRYDLTSRQLHVLRLLCRGMNNESMADELGICMPTVRSHLRSVYAKLDHGDRVGVILELVHGSDRK